MVGIDVATPRPKTLPVLLAAAPGYSIGTLVPVPFVYLAARQRTRSSRLIAALYSALWVLLVVMLATLPDTDGWSTVGGLYLFALATVGTTHAFVLRQSLLRAVPAPASPPAAWHSPSRPPPGADPVAELRHALHVLRSRTSASAVPDDCRTTLESIYRALDSVVAYVGNGGHADAEFAMAQAMIQDYLPTSIDGYLRLPAEFARTTRNAEGKTADEELRTQLRLLQTAVEEATQSMYRDDARRLEQQSLFLQSKFGTSELDLP